MSHICIRRTKEMRNSKGEYLVPLPPVEMTLIPVQLDTAARVSDATVQVWAEAFYATAAYMCIGTVRRSRVTLKGKVRFLH